MPPQYPTDDEDWDDATTFASKVTASEPDASESGGDEEQELSDCSGSDVSYHDDVNERDFDESESASDYCESFSDEPHSSESDQLSDLDMAEDTASSHGQPEFDTTTPVESELEHALIQSNDFNFVYEDMDDLFDGNRFPPEYYLRGIQDLNEEDYDRKDYAESTESTINIVEAQWKQFCANVLKKDWMKCYTEISIKVIYHFLTWVVNQKVGKDGRRKRGIRRKNSLITFWCTFRLAFQRATAYKIDQFIDRSRMHNVLEEVSKHSQLTIDRRPNRSMSLADLMAQVKTTIATTEKSFNLGEQRILAVLFLLLLSPAGSRPSAILQLRFGDIRVVLQRDPLGGPHQLMIKFTLEFTKRYLGKKAAKTFPIPEIIRDPSLFLSPQVFLLGILFRHRAFRSESLNDNPHAIADLDIHNGDNELPLPTKQEIHKDYVFRRAVRTLTGYQMSAQRIEKGVMGGWVKRVGELLGFEHPTICYNLRYMAGNNMDQHNMISESLRNLVMDHAPNSTVFQTNYLSRHITADLWAIHRGSQPQQAIIEQATSHGHSKSARRPPGLTAEQSASLDKHPSIVKLKNDLRKLTVRTPKYRKQKARIHAAKSQLRTAMKKNFRSQWTNQQAVEDIERQVQGVGFAPETARASRPMSPAQRRLFDALMAPHETDLPALFRRRAAAVDAIIAYCAIQEPAVTKILDARPVAPPAELQHASGITAAFQLKASVMAKSPADRLLRCFLCVAKALTLPPDDLNYNNLCQPFSTPATATRHFRNSHLAQISDKGKEWDRVQCPICVPAVRLVSKVHLQNHASDVHGMKTVFGHGPKF